MDTSDEDADSTSNGCSKNGFNVVDSQDLDKADLDAMRGDTIGDTVYSSKWILKTLISLSKVYEEEWSKALENDLCMLWDMTAEKDVVLFLKDNDFLQIAEFTLKISTEPRLTEIILGIVGNMCCLPTVLEALGNADNLIAIIFDLLSTDDTETLIQILRLLQTFVWDIINNNPETKWLRHLKNCEFLSDGLSFILQSSTNDDLLISAVNLLESISIVRMPDDSCLLVDLIKVDKLVPALVECFNQLIPKNDVNYSRVDLKFIINWLTIFTTIIQSKLEIFSIQSSNEIIGRIIECLYKILQPYVHSGNLFPLDEKLSVCIQDCIVMINWFQRKQNNNDPKVICLIVTIMQEIRSAIKVDSEMDRIMDMDEAKELAKYLEKYWLETVRAYEDNELLEIIQLCDKDVITCLMDVAKEYSEEDFHDTVVKLSRVESLFVDR